MNRISRREMGIWTAGAALAAAGVAMHPVAWAREPGPAEPPLAERRLMVVVFGGGTRASETVADVEHRYIPRLWKELVPHGTLWTNMRVEGPVVHPNCTAAITTGHREWDDLEWTRPVAHPTIFEIVRKQRQLPDTAAWAFVYASILAKTGFSSAEGYGERFAANVVEPPTIPRSTAEEMDHRMAEAAQSGSREIELRAAGDCEALVRATSRIERSGLRSNEASSWVGQRFERWQKATGTTSHDAFLAEMAIACIEDFSPNVMSVAFGEIDSAHYGSRSRYVQAIHRTDELTWRLWQAVQTHHNYRNRTLMLVLPDHGRQFDRPGTSGFLHHTDFYKNEEGDEGCRRVWMLAIGPGVAAGCTIDRPVPTAAAAATGLEFLGLAPSCGAVPSARIAPPPQPTG